MHPAWCICLHRTHRHGCIDGCWGCCWGCCLETGLNCVATAAAIVLVGAAVVAVLFGAALVGAALVGAALVGAALVAVLFGAERLLESPI